MAISYTPYNKSTTSGINYNPYTVPTTAYPSSYVIINTPVPNYVNPAQNGGVFTKFVNSEQEAANQPNPVQGCAFYLDGEKLILYVKYADGRPMETYDMKLREAPKTPQYLTAEDFNDILDRKLDELSKKFVMRKDRGNQNG